MYMISSPYTDTDKTVIEARMDQLNDSIATLTKKGFLCVSPLWNHYVCARNPSFGTTWEFWKDYCHQMIDSTEAIIVLDNIEGWDKSVGVQNEIEYAKREQKGVFYYSQLVCDTHSMKFSGVMTGDTVTVQIGGIYIFEFKSEIFVKGIDVPAIVSCVHGVHQLDVSCDPINWLNPDNWVLSSPFSGNEHKILSISYE